jgi:hypothetical protein
MVISFENFVLNPLPTLSQLKQWPSLGKPIKVDEIMRKERVPRGHINMGRPLSIYKRYGAGALESSASMKADFQKQELFAKRQLKPDIFRELQLLSERYLKYFGEWYL